MTQLDLLKPAPLARQKPIDGKEADTIGALTAIVMHPAFRLGFLDALHERPVAHDHIITRIQDETPAGALRRLGWDWLFNSKPLPREVEVAQYRYEEGRLAQRMFGLRCKAWGHPDYPPAQVRSLVEQLARERAPQKEAA